MRLAKAVRTAGVALLCLLASAGVSARAEAAAVTVPIPAECPALAATELGMTKTGAFTTDVQSACFALPTLPEYTAVAVLQPATSSRTVWLNRTVVTGDGTVLCNEALLAARGCLLSGLAAPYRLLLAPHWVDDTGPYALTVQPLSGDTGCGADLPLGRVGSADGVDATLSAGAFFRCYSLPAGGHSAHELVTMAHTAGVGGARFSVYDPTGVRVCGTASAYDVALAAVVPCAFSSSTAYTMLIWNQGLDATFQLARRDLAPDALDCPAPTSTAFGGPATVDSIGAAAQPRCYTFTAGPGDRYFVALRSPGTTARMTWVEDGGETFCANRACVTSAAAATRKYRVVVWAATAGAAVPFQLDTWAVTTKGVVTPGCETVPSIAFEWGPLTGTMTDDHPGRCVLAQVGRGDYFQVTVDKADGTPTTLPTAYIVDVAGSVDNEYNLSSCTSSCWVASNGQSSSPMQAMIIISPGAQSGEVPYKAKIRCVYSLCGGEPYAIAAVSPATAVKDSKVTLTLTGAAFDSTDTVQLSRAGSATISTGVRSVSADRHTLTAEVDLLGAEVGAWDVTATSARAGVTVKAAALTVDGPPLVATAAPTFRGTVQVGATIRATTGTWEPAPSSLSYQWFVDGVPIRNDRGAVYTIPASLVGHRLSVTVTARLRGYLDGVSTSTAVVVTRGPAPKATKGPKITGTARVKRTVKVSVGTWSPKPDSYTCQWLLNGKVIKGATGTSLKITKGMVGKKLQVVVTARRAGHKDGRSTSSAKVVKK